MNGHKGGVLLVQALPPARELLGIEVTTATRSGPPSLTAASPPCILLCKNRKLASAYDKVLHRQRHRIENALARIKDWRPVVTRHDRCAHTCFSAICIAAVVIFWLG
jgi:transposase